MKIYASEKYGSYYWVETVENFKGKKVYILCFLPIEKGNQTIDTDNGAEVEFHLLPEQEQKTLQEIKEKLCKSD